MTDPTTTNEPRGGFSRRKFLRGSGAAAAAAAIVARPSAADDKEGAQSPVFSGATTIKLNVNGEDREVRVEPRTTLLEALRYGLDLTGAKPVSVHAATGASTVLVDDRPIEAATTLAVACVGKKIRTVESLDGADPVPKAFLDCDAQQCGFCTPGFVMAVRTFLDRNPNATEEDIRKGLNGNLCRCGTYANVLQAVTAAAKGG